MTAPTGARELEARRAGASLVAWRVVTGLTAAFLTFSVASVVTLWGLRRFGVQPSPYALVMVTVSVALCLVAVAGAIINKVGVPRQRQVWQSILDGIDQIARGNFRARIRVGTGAGHPRLDHPIQQLADSLNTMAADLAKLDAMRQEFIANVSHELHSPLAAIAGFAQLLKTQALDSQAQQHYLDIIHSESRRLSRLTDNLLQLASLESGHHPVHAEPFEVDRQIRTAIVALEPLWSAKNLEMEVTLPPLTATADADLVNQVWVNLLTNAIKFTPPGGTIRVSARRAGDGVAIAVADTGIGVSPEDQTRIFERFYKADKARTRTTDGSGLGLAITKTILALNHGSIAVESALHQGTTVSIWLPAGSPTTA